MIHRIKSPVKFAEKLTKISSTVKGLVQLCYSHNIKNNLRDSDITDKLHKIIGEEKLTKFLINIYISISYIYMIYIYIYTYIYHKCLSESRRRCKNLPHNTKICWGRNRFYNWYKVFKILS